MKSEGEYVHIIFEDNGNGMTEQVRRLAESLLKNYDYKVLAVVDGEEGLKVYTKNKGIKDLAKMVREVLNA